jgi:hypothetical protein
MGTPPVFLVSASIAGKHTLHVAQQAPQRMHGLERERFLPYLFNDGHQYRSAQKLPFDQL